MITQDRLKELFEYEDGNLIRKVSRGRGVTSKRWPAGSVLGSKKTDGYFLASVDYHLYKLHRLIWLWHYGSFPNGQIDHIDGNPSNNRIENLREATPGENMQNQTRPRINNKLGVQGVYKVGSRYRAVLTKDKKNSHLGYFDSPQDAHKAYLEAKKQHHPFGTI